MKQQYFSHKSSDFFCLYSLWRGIRVIAFLAFIASASGQPLDIIWDRPGPDDSSRYGFRIHPLGDQNNDGFADWTVYGYGRSGENGFRVQSIIDFFLGGDPPSTEPLFTISENPQTDGAISMYVVGDINGDGFKDWVVHRFLQPDSGIWEWHYGGLPLDSMADSTSSSYPGVPIGDFNGDGSDDLCVTYSRFGDPIDSSQIYFGGNPIDTIPDLIIRSRPGYEREAFPVSFGDVNGDGYRDFISNASFPDLSTAVIFLGSANPDSAPDYTWPDAIGYKVGIISDLNADGFDEIIRDIASGATVYWGRETLSSQPDFSVIFPGGPEEMLSGGDFNGDGYGDLLMSMPSMSSFESGAAALYLGHPWVYPFAPVYLQGRHAPLNLPIETAVGLGDVNNDGYDDIGVGCTGEYSDAEFRGHAFVIAGSNDFVADAPEPRVPVAATLEVSVFPNPFNAETTFRINGLRGGELYKLRVYSLLGRVVYQNDVIARSSHEDVHFAGRETTGNALSTGMYLLLVEQRELRNITKLLILQ